MGYNEDTEKWKLHDDTPENMHVHGLNLIKISQYYTVCDRLTLSI